MSPARSLLPPELRQDLLRLFAEVLVADLRAYPSHTPTLAPRPGPPPPAPISASGSGGASVASGRSGVIPNRMELRRPEAVAVGTPWGSNRRGPRIGRASRKPSERSDDGR